MVDAAVSRWRLGVWTGVLLGWLVMLLFMWSAFSALPSAERLEQTRMMQIPTLQTLGMLVLRSAVELAFVLLLLLPWWRRFYTTRLVAAALLLAGWFLATTPLTISAMHWVHRRWLAAMIAALLACAVIAAAARLSRPERT
jgi:hypothetical protein